MEDTVNHHNQMSADTQIEIMNTKHEEIAKGKDNKNFQSNDSGISGASNFSFASDFTVVNKAQKQFKQKVIEKQIEKFMLSKFNKFHESQSLVDRIIHKSAVLKAFFNPKFN